MTFKEKYFGDKAFYRTLFAILIPVVVQNTFSNFVSLLDNVMVGRLGTESMSGVSVANQMFFVFNLAIFGLMSGAGIYGAQYAGRKEWEGVRITLRYKFVTGTVITALFTLLFVFFGDKLIMLFLTDDGSSNLELTLSEGVRYMRAVLPGMIPLAITNAFASTLRETGQTRLPMRASIAAVFTNLVFNYILIFGKLGAPALGVAGAAYATVLSRFVEIAVMIIGSRKEPFAKGLLHPFRIPLRDAWLITKQGFALMMNETMWSLGNTLLTQFYSTRGLLVIGALNISSTVCNLFMAGVFSMGTAVAIIIGQLLGAGKIEEAKRTDRKLIFFGVLSCSLIALILAAVAPYIPNLYKTSDEVRALATRLIWINACFMVLDSFFNTCYYTLRAGGNSAITIIFDSGFLWVIVVPIAALLAYRTELEILPLFILVQLPYLLKIFIGGALLKKGTWARNLVEEGSDAGTV